MKTQQELQEITKKRLEILEILYIEHCTYDDLLMYICQSDEERKRMVTEWAADQDQESLEVDIKKHGFKVRSDTLTTGPNGNTRTIEYYQ